MVTQNTSERACTINISIFMDNIRTNILVIPITLCDVKLSFVNHYVPSILRLHFQPQVCEAGTGVDGLPGHMQSQQPSSGAARGDTTWTRHDTTRRVINCFTRTGSKSKCAISTCRVFKKSHELLWVVYMCSFLWWLVLCQLCVHINSKFLLFRSFEH